MISSRIYGAIIAAIFAGALSQNVYAGTLPRAYLSASGKDTNPCTLAAPCRLLPAALTAVQDGGEVWILDSANYNTSKVSVSQSVTILSVPGALGSLLTTNDNAIEIAGSINLTLRNVAFRKGAGDLGAGVYVGSGTVQLLVENSDFNAISGGGIVWQPSASGQLSVNHSTFRNNGTGVTISGSGVNAVIDHCNIVGLRSATGSGTAVYTFGANVVISHSSITHSYYGIGSDGSANITLEDNVIADNTIGVKIFTSGGSVQSNGNNTFQINGTNVDGGSLTQGTRL